MILLKTEAELCLLRQSGKILARVLGRLKEQIKPGVTTGEIDNLAQGLTVQENALAAFKGYKGYPASVCISINEEIVHGIPGPRVIAAGDIVSLDLGINYNGYFSDAAITVAAGKIDSRGKKLIEVTRKALFAGVAQAKSGNRLFDISHAIQSFVEKNGFSVVRHFVGHGIGKSLHEEPEIPNFGQPHKGPLLKNGMVLAIEPMVNEGAWESRITENGWTAVTKDGKRSAHFEHTVALTAKGPQILTA
jgi:methionyl aminopeptidase